MRTGDSSIHVHVLEYMYDNSLHRSRRLLDRDNQAMRSEGSRTSKANRIYVHWVYNVDLPVDLFVKIDLAGLSLRIGTLRMYVFPTISPCRERSEDALEDGLISISRAGQAGHTCRIGCC